MANRLLASASALALGCYCAPAMADPLTVSSAQTTPVRTSAAANGTSGDITITSAGSIAPTAAGAAVTIDSANSVTNQGSITFSGVDNATGIVANAGVTGNITNAGTITVNETYVRTDTNSDGVPDGPYAQGTNRFGIRTLGVLNGNVTNSGTITVQGNDSAGISLGGALNGALSQTGTITVAGDNSFGVRTGAVSGNVTLGGAISAFGTGSSGVVLGGDVGGALAVNATIATSGYSSVTLPASVTGLTASNLLQGGPAFWIQGNVAGGANFAGATTTTNADNTTTTTAGAAITNYGSSPALLIGSASNAITLGPVASDAGGFGLLVGGGIAGNGVYSNVNGTGAQIGGLGGAVTITNGIRVTGSIGGSSNGGSATGLYLANGATTPTLTNSGTLSAQVTALGTVTNPAATALLIDAGAQLGSITNLATISATGVTGAQTGTIVDRSGRVGLIHNSGTIAASGGTSNVAINVSASTTGVSIVQDNSTGGFTNPSITGDILFGGGSNSLSASVGAIVGNVTFGGSGNSFALSGTAAYAGNANFAGTTGTLTIGSGASFAGAVQNASLVGVTVNGGTFSPSATTATQIGSLTVNGGTLNIGIDAANGASSLVQVVGNAGFGSSSVLNVQFQHLNDALGTFTVLQAGSLTGTGNLTLSQASVPFLFNRSLAANATNTALIVTTTRKTATDLGLAPTLAAVYEPAYAAALGDQPIGDTLLSLTSAAGLDHSLRQLLPNFSGGVFDSTSLATRAATKALADRNLQTVDTGRLGAWVQLVGWADKKSVGSTAGYNNYGSGLTGGIERRFGQLGSIGASVSYLVGVVNDVGTAAGINQDEVLFNLYWRASWGRLHAYATGGIGNVQLDSSRYFDGISSGATFSRTATGKWGSTLYTGLAGASYELPLGRLYVRPEVSVDYVRLKENAYTETGGGTGLDLSVSGRSSSESAVNGSLVVGYYLTQPKEADSSFARIELLGGDRALLSSTLGTTTAQFGNGNAFTLTPEARRSGWTGGLRASAGNGIFSVTADASAERQQDHVAGLARLGVSFHL